MSDTFQYQRASALKNRPKVEWLVESLIVRGGVTTLFAQPGEGKTFLGLHYALKVATERGPTLFIAGEGDGDLAPRIAAWQRLHRVDDAGLEKPGAGFLFLGHEVNLFDDSATTAWIASLEASPPVLIVLDALADNMAGADEDKARDMSRVFANVLRLIRSTGAAVLVIHHAGWSNTHREKGSIVTRAKSDIVAGAKLQVLKGRLFLDIECHKNRKGKKFKTIHMELKEVVTTDGPTLAVANSVGLLDMPSGSGDDAKLDKAISVFRSQFVATGAPLTAWMKAIQKDVGTTDGWSLRTCERLFARLVEDGRVKGGGKRGEPFYLGSIDQPAPSLPAPAFLKECLVAGRTATGKIGVAGGMPVPVIDPTIPFTDPKPDPGRVLNSELENALAMMGTDDT